MINSIIKYELRLGYKTLAVNEPVFHKGTALLEEKDGFAVVKIPTALSLDSACTGDPMYWIVGTSDVLRLMGCHRAPQIDKKIVSEWKYSCSENNELSSRVYAAKKFLEAHAACLAFMESGQELAQTLKSWPRDARVALLGCGWGPHNYVYGLPSDCMVAAALEKFSSPQRGLRLPLVLSGSVLDEDGYFSWSSTYEIYVD